MIKLKIFTLLCSIFLTLNLYANKNYELKDTHIYKNLDYLELNASQEKQIKEILIECRKEFSKYYAKKQKAQNKLQKLIQEQEFDDDKYEDITEDIAKEAIELEIKIFKQIHQILTPKQREEFSHYLQEWRIE